MTTFDSPLLPVDADATAPPIDSSDPNLPSVVPRFRSRFGGLWTDLSNAPALLAGRRALGRVNDEEAARLERWIESGYVILKGAVPPAVVDAAQAELSATLEGELPKRKAEWWTDEGKRFGDATAERMMLPGAKLLDLHFTSEATQKMIFHAPIARFLELIFDRPALAFQSLGFTHGTRQPVHQDTAFVRVSSAMEFVAVWIALEDVVEGSGELEYYPGSHALPEELFEGRYKWVPEGSDEIPNYSERLHERAAEAGLSLQRFLPRKGDALIWAADLIHGGRAEVEPGLTRRSFVTHYCPVDQAPHYFRKDTGRTKVRTPHGGWVCEEKWY